MRPTRAARTKGTAATAVTSTDVQLTTLSIAVATAACWSTKAGPPSPTVEDTRSGSSTFDASTCPRDAIVESVCGGSTRKRCGPRGDSLHSIDVSHLFVSEPAVAVGSTFDADDRGHFRDFVLDWGVTSRYREDLTAEAELAPAQVEAHCCYSRCTPLVIGVPAPAPAPIPLPTPERCIPRTPVGATRPAPTDGHCPIGVKLNGVIRRYVHTTDDQCCYDMRP